MNKHLYIFALLVGLTGCVHAQSVQIGGQVSIGGQIGIQAGGAAPFVITTTATPSGTYNTAYSQTVQTANGTAPVSCVLKSQPNDLPNGVTLNSACLVSGTPTQAGNFNFTVQATDSSNPAQQVTKTLSLVISCGAQLQILTSPTLPDGTAGQAYSFQMQSSGGVSPLTWSLISGSLDGASISTGGLISGTLASPGSFSPNIQVSDSCSPAQVASNTYALSVAGAGGALSLNTTTPLPSCTVNVACTIPLSASGGTAPYTFTDPGNWLPAGLSISGSSITGTPTVSGSSSGTLQVTDSASNTNQGQSPYSLTVNVATGADNGYCTPSGTWSGPTTDGPASLPQHCYYTALSGTPSPGLVWTTNAAGLQNAYNLNAHCGDIITVAAGSSYTGTVTLNGKGCDDQHYITIESTGVNNVNFPSEGTTATPAIAAVASLPNRPAYSCPNCPTVLAPQFITPASSNAFRLNGADHIRFIGLEITRVTTAGVPIYNLVDMTSSGTQTNHIIFDRVWMHGVNHDGLFPATSTSNDTSTTRGIYLGQSNHVAVIDSYFSDFYDDGSTASNGNTDAQAIAGGVGSITNSGWGVYKFVHNHLEGASETILLGGSTGPALTPTGCTFGVTCNDDVPTDIEVRRNYLFKSQGWFGNGASTGWPNVKNGIEFKTGARILLEANIMENCWYNSQPYCYGFDFAPKNQSAGGNPNCPSCLDEDFTARYNYVYHYPGPQIAIYASMDAGCSLCSTLGRRGSVHDNLVGDNMNTAWGTNTGTGFDCLELLADAGPMQNITINHNTCVNSKRSWMVYDAPNSTNFNNITIQDNLSNLGSYAAVTSGSCTKNTNTFYQNLQACFGTWTVDHNAGFNWCTTCIGSQLGRGWPTDGNGLGNWYFLSPTVSGTYKNNLGATATGTPGFTNYQIDSGFNPDNYILTNTSPLHNAGSDGKDLGADINTLQQKIAGVKQ